MSQPTTTVRLSTPGEVAATIPSILGFEPAESIVVLTFAENRRLGVAMRVDRAFPILSLIAEVVEQRPASIVVAFYTAGDHDACRTDLAILSQLFEVRDALLVHDGRWRSLVCDNPECCPPDSPIPTGTVAEAELLLHGRARLASREEVVAAVAYDPDSDFTWTRSTEEPCQMFARMVLAMSTGVAPASGDLDALTTAVTHDVLDRDRILGWLAGDIELLTPALEVLRLAARRTPPPNDPAIVVLVAITAYMLGDGVMTSAALRRCLDSDPDYGLARLIAEALSRRIQPSAIADMLSNA